MHVLALMTALLLFQPRSTGAVCWVDVGAKAEYTSGDQVRELQRQAKSKSCDVLALAWRVKPIPARQSMLLWDAKQQSLYRVHVEGSASHWEKWSGATKDRILLDDPSDGFDLPSYSEGRGRVGLTSSAVAFVHKHAPKKFDPAL
jgi:hypothetical protein